MENKELKMKLGQLQEEISKASLPVSADLSNDFKSIILETDQRKILPFMRLFWEEQQKYLQSSPNNVKYHLMIIRYCLSLASKSAAAYDDICYNEKTGTVFVILPSRRRRLRNYKNYIRPQRGFNKDIVNELLEKVKHFSDNKKVFVMLMDEMKIQENLVWDKHTGNLIGYVDFGDAELNYATLQKSTDIATHVLVLLRSVVNPFKFSLANFATTGATSSQMFPLLWREVYLN